MWWRRSRASLVCNWICCTLRSGLHEIPTMIRTFPHGLENNHGCKWTCDNFPGMLTYVLFLENCQKTICFHGDSPIHVDRSLRVSNLGDKSVPYFSTEKGPFHMDWRTTVHASGVLTIFQECRHTYYSWKIVLSPFACMVVLQPMWKGPFSVEKYGTDLSPRLDTLKDLS